MASFAYISKHKIKYMNKRTNFCIKGVTGVSYDFDAFYISGSLEELKNMLGAVPGVCAFLHLDSDSCDTGNYRLLYCGETSNLCSLFDTLPSTGISSQATLFCFVYEPSELVRKDILTDILLGNYSVYNEQQN